MNKTLLKVFVVVYHSLCVGLLIFGVPRAMTDTTCAAEMGSISIAPGDVGRSSGCPQYFRDPGIRSKQLTGSMAIGASLVLEFLYWFTFGPWLVRGADIPTIQKVLSIVVVGVLFLFSILWLVGMYYNYGGFWYLY